MCFTYEEEDTLKFLIVTPYNKINKLPTFLLQIPVICHLFYLYLSPKREEKKAVREINVTS